MMVDRTYSSEMEVPDKYRESVTNIDVSVTLDYELLHGTGKTILQLPIVIERRYLLPDDRGLSQSERFISTEESTLLCNSLVIKHLILDYQIWCKTSPEIQG